MNSASVSCVGPARRLFCSGLTHPGVEHRQNQDSFFVWREEEGTEAASYGHLVACCLDGHGRELGQAAAFAARDALELVVKESMSKDNFAAFRADPVRSFQQAFDAAHKAIGDVFVQTLKDAGYTTKWEEGALFKSAGLSQRWQSVSGGTTCTMVVVLDGHRCFIANVGDSDCLACSKPAAEGPEARPHPLKVHAVQTCGALPAFASVGGGSTKTTTTQPATSGEADPHTTEAEAEAATVGGGTEPAPAPATDTEGGAPAKKAKGGAEKEEGREDKESKPVAGLDQVHYVECTAEHSAECLREFLRMRDFRPSPGNPRVPDIQFLYDAFGYMKSNRPHVFKERPDEPGVFDKTNKGVYHKNVRAEFASLVSTPPHSRYQDGLAFTRSLGDFYLHTYGVSSTVDVQYLDLLASSSGSDAEAGTKDDDSLVAICLCSDGVWDNWKYADIVKEIISPPFMKGLQNCETSGDINETAASAVERNAVALMRLNHARATANFGSSMDNMTLVLLYVLPPLAQQDGPPAAKASSSDNN